LPLPFTDHFALHGNAFNPDTGQLAEYSELSKCSEGVGRGITIVPFGSLTCDKRNSS
jgi:hypothetical protein